MTALSAHALFGYSLAANRTFTQQIRDNGSLYPSEISGQKWGRDWTGMTAVTVVDAQKTTRDYVLGCGDGKTVFLHNITSYGALGAETWRGSLDGAFSVCCSYRTGSKTYVLLHNPNTKKYDVCPVSDTGKLETATASGSWSLGYQTLFTVTVTDVLYLVGHSSSENRFFIEPIDANGKPTGSDTTNQKWGSYYATLIPITVGDAVYIFGQNRSKRWFTQKIEAGGKLASKESATGSFANYYGTATSYSAGGATYLMGQSDSEKNKWFTQQIYSNGTLASKESANAHFANYYSFLTVFESPDHLPSDCWMTELYESILKTKTLKEIIMPGSHDAGMSTARECSIFGTAGNTQTQRLPMIEQLISGSRYFDLRPIARTKKGVITYQTGHFNDSSEGCFGETLDEICNAIKQFASVSGREHELIILKFSHYMSDNDGTFSSNWSDSQKTAFGAYMTKSLGDVVIRSSGSPRLGTLPYSQLMGLSAANKPKVLIVMDSINSTVRKTTAGIFRYADYPYDKVDPTFISPYVDLCVYDQYSKTDDAAVMIAGQKEKLLHKPNHGGDMYLLSWTLTQQEDLKYLSHNVLDLADEANNLLSPRLEQWMEDGEITVATLPNIIYVDSLSDEQANLTHLLLNQVYKKS